MKAIVLAGGFATRLRPLSCTRPKALFPVVNKPLLEWTFERLEKHNIRDVIMAVNHQTEIAVKEQKIPTHTLRVMYSRDPPRKPLGTGGPIKKAEKLIGHDSSFLVLNGDIFADVNYTRLLETHRKTRATATIALCKVDDPSRFGVAELAKDNCIRRFFEKPSPEEAPSKLINAGVYAFHPEIFEYMPENRAVSTEREVFPKLAKEKKLYGYIHSDLWMDIGKPEEYLEINRILLNRTKGTQNQQASRGSQVREPVAIGKAAVIGKRSVIGPNTVLGHDTVVGDDVRIQDSVVFDGAEIDDSTRIQGAIIGGHVKIGKRVSIPKACILGDYVKIRDDVSLAEGVTVCPAKEISESVATARNICC
ncbi:MAG: NDP-sugar synthase [Candidatus Bathyarchaeota archaeon]|nr:NDP-sugar synthase [Candidatus Bathyarchaeota archaeon]